MLSVIVKVFNEEKNIARCIESILHETEGLEREIIVVDSLSTDQTVTISKQYPVKVVQFVNQDDCGCGAAPQLGYQVSKGSLIYLIDGDMELVPGFLRAAISCLSENPSVAGVGGLVVDRTLETFAERRRQEAYRSIKSVTDVSFLGGGGLYRRQAIESVDYFSHFGLKATEEFELGLRLKHKGWRMVRLPVISIMHSGHDESYIASVVRLWRNGRYESYGQLIRSAVGKKWFVGALFHCWFAFFPILMMLLAFFIVCAGDFFTSQPVSYWQLLAFFFLIVIFLLVYRKKSFILAIMSFISWHIVMFATIKGLLRRPRSPYHSILFREI